jgi:hypothetical protein
MVRAKSFSEADVTCITPSAPTAHGSGRSLLAPHTQSPLLPRGSHLSSLLRLSVASSASSTAGDLAPGWESEFAVARSPVGSRASSNCNSPMDRSRSNSYAATDLQWTQLAVSELDTRLESDATSAPVGVRLSSITLAEGVGGRASPDGRRGSSNSIKVHRTRSGLTEISENASSSATACISSRSRQHALRALSAGHTGAGGRRCGGATSGALLPPPLRV